jgi:hypothetical protein
MRGSGRGVSGEGSLKKYSPDGCGTWLVCQCIPVEAPTSKVYSPGVHAVVLATPSLLGSVVLVSHEFDPCGRMAD